jgi:hypothetical protein
VFSFQDFRKYCPSELYFGLKFSLGWNAFTLFNPERGKEEISRNGREDKRWNWAA